MSAQTGESSPSPGIQSLPGSSGGFSSILASGGGWRRCGAGVGTEGVFTENEAPRLQSRLPLPPPAMLCVKRSYLVWSTALAVLCVTCLVRVTSRHSRPSAPAMLCVSCLVALSSQRSQRLIPASRCASWALSQLIRMTSCANVEYALMSPLGPLASPPTPPSPFPWPPAAIASAAGR